MIKLRFASLGKQHQARKFRELLLETFEPRQLMTADLGTLSLGLQKPETAHVAEVPAVEDILVLTQSKAGFQQTSSVLSGGSSLKSNPEQGALATYLSQPGAAVGLDDRVAVAAAWHDFESRQVAANAHISINDFDLIRTLEASPNSLRKQLLGYGLLQRTENTDLDDVTPGVAQMAQGIRLGDLLVVSQSSSSSSGPTNLEIVTSIGWFCAADGTSSSGFLAEGEDSSSGSGSYEGGGSSSGSGSSSGGGEIAIPFPEVEFPQLEAGTNPGPLNEFSPSLQAAVRAVDTVGAYDENTTTVDDLTLPGVNYVHIVDRNWIDATQWSVTETLVMSFNVSASAVPPSDSDDSDGSSGSGSTSEDTTHDVTLTSSSLITVTRTGFIILTFHAERGISTPADAGVKWSLDLAFSDKVSVVLAMSGASSVAPTAVTNSTTSGSGSSGVSSSGSSGSGSSGDEYGSDSGDTGYGEPTEPALPASYTGTSSWGASAGVSVWATATFSVSSTPSLYSPSGLGDDWAVQRDITYSDDIEVGSGLLLGRNSIASSRSGDLNTHDPSLGLPGAPTGLPLLPSIGGGGSEEAQPTPPSDVDVPEDGVLSLDAETVRTGWAVDPAASSPIPKPKGRGHQHGSSGNASTSLTNRGTGGISFNARMRANDVLTSLSGSVRDGFARQYGDQITDNEVFVFQDGEQDANSGWTATFVMGRNVSPEVRASAGRTVDLAFTLGANNDVVASPSVDTEYFNSSGSDNRLTFDDLTIQAAARSTDTLGSESYWQGKLIQRHGSAGTSSGSIEVESTVGSPDTGELQVKTDMSGFEYESISGRSVGHKVFAADPNAGYGGGTADSATSDKDTWSFLYSSDIDVTNSLASDGSVVSTGAADNESEESISYHSYSKYDREQKYLPSGRSVDSNLRYAHFDQTMASAPSTDPSVTEPVITISGDDQVQVSGHNNSDIYDFHPFHCYSKTDLATGEYRYYNGGEEFVAEPPSDYDPRNNYERFLDGTDEFLVQDPSAPPLPPDYVYPSNPSANNTWLVWFGGSNGDTADVMYTEISGAADNLTLNLTWFLREKVIGEHSIDYNGSDYNKGQWIGFGVGLLYGASEIKGILTLGQSMINSAAGVFRCGAPIMRLLAEGGCFVAGTLVTLSEMPRTEAMEAALWSSDVSFPSFDFGGYGFAEASAVAVTPRPRLLVPIEQVPIGARVMTKNPKPWEVDDTLPTPDEETWAKICLTVKKSDGAVVDAELIRPRAWVQANGLAPDLLLPLKISEFDITELAHITEISNCPAIAQGDGNVVTGKYLTREVHEIIRATLVDAAGTVELLEGTSVHPIWSVDRADWVPLGGLVAGEQLWSESGAVLVSSVAKLHRPMPVYNIEVAGQHVYEVGRNGVLAHNTQSCLYLALEAAGYLRPTGRGWQAAHIVPQSGFSWAAEICNSVREKVNRYGLMNAAENGFWAKAGHAGTHTREYIERMGEVFENANTREQVEAALATLWAEIKNGNFLP